MPRPRNAIPTYRLHKQSGQAIVTISKPDGTRQDVLLGTHGSPESKQEYERIIAQLRVAPHSPLTGKASADVSLNEILVAFFKFAEKHYRDSDGQPTGETANYRDTVRPLVKLYGLSPASEFGPLTLKAVRQAMVESGLSRGVVNNRVNRIRRIMKWAAGEELIPFEVYHRLTAVVGLGKGRTEAREPEPVGPVADDVVNATLPQLPNAVRVTVEIQRLTGMRPNEVCKLSEEPQEGEPEEAAGRTVHNGQLPAGHPTRCGTGRRGSVGTEPTPTLVRKHHGIEAAQVLLGHAKADVTQVYAERDLGLALKVAAEIGWTPIRRSSASASSAALRRFAGVLVGAAVGVAVPMAVRNRYTAASVVMIRPGKRTCSR